ncbi:MAG: ice-binding family protein [Ilumatobacteraceae bacterium]
MTSIRVATRPTDRPRRRARAIGLPFALLSLLALAPAAVFLDADGAAAAVPNVELGTAANYAVLGGSMVSNTGNSTLDGSLGVSPGSAITGFPPGQVLAPWVIDVTNGAAAQAQSDLTTAYVDAAGRSVDATTTADLGGLLLQPGVYATTNHGALQLTGTLTLDGLGDPGSVFIFQTDSSLITASSSTVALINGAQECNIYWQVGSSATLGTGSVFAGNILALTAVTVNTGVTVHGRAMARNAAVTLDNDVFTRPTCEQAPPVTTTTTEVGATTIPGGSTTLVGGESSTTVRSRIPATGSHVGDQLAIAGATAVIGVACILVVRRRRLV